MIGQQIALQCAVFGFDVVCSTMFRMDIWSGHRNHSGNFIRVYFQLGQALYPVECTLLVTGIVEAAKQARASKSRVLKTQPWNLVTRHGTFEQ